MKKSKVVYILIIIVILTLFTIIQSGILTSFINNYRLQKINNYNTSKNLSILNIKSDLIQLSTKNNFKTGGYVYNITQPVSVTIESRNSYGLYEDKELTPEACFYVYFSNNDIDEAGKLLLTITTSKNGMVRRLKEGTDGIEISINDYMDQVIQSLQTRKDMFTRSRSNLINNKPDNVYYQKVYDNLVKSNELTFYDCYSYEWFPYYNSNNEGLPYFNNLENPTTREYQAYLYSDTFLIKIDYSVWEGWDELEIEELQNVTFDVLNNINIYVPQN